MVTIGMNYFVRPGKERVFEDAFESVRRALEAAEGHDESKLYRAVRGAGGDGSSVEYLIVSRWTSEEAFQDFVASESFRKVTRWGAENILTGPPQHTTYGAS